MFDVVIVNYNKPLGDITVLPQLEAEALVERILVCDNSTRDMGLRRDALGHQKLAILPMAGNVGLPRAYNAAIERSDASFICLLDDDSPIPKDFFSLSARHIATNPSADIFLPVVSTPDGKVMSPVNRGKYVPVRMNSIDELGDTISAINSGMIVRSSVYETYRYDETLFLDFVDHRFMDDMRTRGITYCIMRDVRFVQNSSRLEFNPQAERARYRIYAKDAVAFWRTWPLDYRVHGQVHLWGRKLALARKYHDVSFLFL